LFIKTNQITTYALFATIFSFSTFFEAYPYAWVVKIVPILILIFIALQNQQTISDKLFVAGLIASLCGDFFLGYDGVNWFIFGLASFLVAHLFYMASLAPITLALIKKRLIPMIIYVMFALSMFNIIAPGLDKLFVPVLIYMSILLLMGISTLISEKSNLWLILGGISFVASDTLLGVDKFYTAIPYSHFFIMVTYYFAQFALIKGIFSTEQDQKNMQHH
jgi:alkenylglycerophosphocholine/alkenylglycerophosphoethanolamine hydrolase